ncbi:alpha/beta hydrolase [Corticicoccus populi]|uniref:Alpha/beta hydrolase n=1 Tax=Corticicoccus populi TaxID=1812821 RepID=A0ABW5WRF0_9STAP
MNSLWNWVLVLITAVLMLLLSLAYYASSRTLYFKLLDNETIRKREIRRKRLDEKEFDALQKDDVTIPSKYGYGISTTFVYPNDTNKWIVLCHGLAENKISQVKYMNMFIDMGYNCVLYDARRHGDTPGKNTTYGYYEKYDLETVIEYMLEHYGEDIKFGIHGESMGAATLLLYAGELSNKADFYISNASFARFSDQLTRIFSGYSEILTPVVLPISNIFFLLRGKFSLYKVSPLNIIDKIEQPVLFIHSVRDSYIPYTQTKLLFEKKRTPKASWYPARGGHVESFNRNKLEYQEKITSFIENHVEW